MKRLTHTGCITTIGSNAACVTAWRIDTEMFGRTEPDQKNVQLVVKDEQELYTSFSPEDEFTDSVKKYIQSKITGRGFNGFVGLTVISGKPINEERFKLAVKTGSGMRMRSSGVIEKTRSACWSDCCYSVPRW